MPPSIALSVSQLGQTFEIPEPRGEPLYVLKNISFEAYEGEIICILGPSGCGKTTLLRILAGLTKPTEGLVLASGVPIERPSPERILLFQDLHLFEWMTVRGNVEFALEAKGVNKDDWGARITELLELVGLTEFSNYYPGQISGGMRQRLALARALAAEPKVFLMDEPFGALDIETRLALEFEFLALHDMKKFTTILVTHDVRQAIMLADRVLVFSARPAHIRQSISVDFARPRRIGLRSSTAFSGLETILEDSLRSGG